MFCRSYLTYDVLSGCMLGPESELPPETEYPPEIDYTGTETNSPETDYTEADYQGSGAIA